MQTSGKVRPCSSGTQALTYVEASPSMADLPLARSMWGAHFPLDKDTAGHCQLGERTMTLIKVLPHPLEEELWLLIRLSHSMA